MKVYIVCRSWCDSYEDHGWDIMGTFTNYESAEKERVKQAEARREDLDDWFIDELEVLE